MKLFKKTALAAACVGTVLFAGSAFAGGSSSLLINATVIPSCSFFGGPFAMPFGTLDPAAGTNAGYTTGVTYQCSVGTLATNITIGGVSPPTATLPINDLVSGTSLPVHLAWTVPTGVAGTGGGIGPLLPVITMNVVGTILAADIGAAVPGTYSFNYPLVLTP